MKTSINSNLEVSDTTFGAIAESLNSFSLKIMEMIVTRSTRQGILFSHYQGTEGSRKVISLGKRRQR